MDEQTVVSGKCSGSSNITASSSFEKLYFSSDWPLLPNLHDHQILVLHGLAEVSQLLYILYRIPKTNICKLCWKPFLSITKKYFPFWSQGLLTPCTIHLEKTTMILSWTSWSTGWSNLANLDHPSIWNLDFPPRHFRVGMSIVDSTKPAPPLRRDVFWDQVFIFQPFSCQPLETLGVIWVLTFTWLWHSFLLQKVSFHNPFTIYPYIRLNLSSMTSQLGRMSTLQPWPRFCHQITF